MDDEAIIRAVKLYTADWIVLTGGEPALWIDEEFIHLLRRATGKRVAIETNGTCKLPAGIDWVTVSPKCGICGDDAAGEVVVDHADEIKVIDTGQDLNQYFSLPCKGENTLMYLQPCYTADEKEFKKNRLRTVRRVLADPRWTISVQIHRYLQIP
jgi:organic radical activating enzyme